MYHREDVMERTVAFLRKRMWRSKAMSVAVSGLPFWLPLLVVIICLWWVVGHLECLESPAEEGLSRRRALEALVRNSLWWSTLAAGCVALVLAAWGGVALARGGRGWLSAPPEHPQGLASAPAVRAGRWFWVALCLILIVGAVLRVPRLGHSHYNDESHNYTRQLSGIWQNYGEDGSRFRTPTWTDTAFGNQTGNNGFLHSILARLSLERWKRMTDVSEGEIVEWPPRLPPFVAGMAAVALAALIGRRAGWPVAGLVAAFFLALHPWHVRFSTEARGYSLMMAAMLASWYFLSAALQTGCWRHWLGHAFAVLVALWAHLGALLFVFAQQVLLAVVLLAMAWRARRGGGVEGAWRSPPPGCGAMVCRWRCRAWPDCIVCCLGCGS